MSELKKIVFEVLTDPVPLAYPRFVNGNICIPQKSRDYRKKLQQAARIAMAGNPPMSCALICRLSFYRKFQTTSCNYGEIYNHVKAVCDALNGFCYEDDSQLVSVRYAKYTDKLNPRVVIELSASGLEDVALPPLIERCHVLYAHFSVGD